MGLPGSREEAINSAGISDKDPLPPLPPALPCMATPSQLSSCPKEETQSWLSDSAWRHHSCQALLQACSKAVPGDYGSGQEVNLGRKVKSFVGGSAELSEAWFPSACLGCDPCLCGPNGCQRSGIRTEEGQGGGRQRPGVKPRW